MAGRPAATRSRRFCACLPRRLSRRRSTSQRAVDVVAFLWASLALFDEDSDPVDTADVYRPQPRAWFSIPQARARFLRLLPIGTAKGTKPAPPGLGQHLHRQPGTGEARRSDLGAGKTSSRPIHISPAPAPLGRPDQARWSGGAAHSNSGRSILRPKAPEVLKASPRNAIGRSASRCPLPSRWAAPPPTPAQAALRKPAENLEMRSWSW